MPDAPESWEQVDERLRTTRFGDVRRFPEIDSTNRYLLDEARGGAPEGVVAVADHQTAGRGRAGRTWTAPPGSSLLVSVLVRPDLPTGRGHLVTMAAGVAACEAVFLAGGFAPSLKWPNDLVVGVRKLGGMLSEAEVRDGRIAALVVGIGVNVNWEDFPADIAETATACNLVAGERVDRAVLLAHFLQRFEERYAALSLPGGAAATLGEYRARCATIGAEVRVELPDGDVLEGRAVAVDDDGRILVESAGPDGGEIRAMSVGDVVHVRPRR